MLIPAIGINLLHFTTNRYHLMMMDGLSVQTSFFESNIYCSSITKDDRLHEDNKSIIISSAMSPIIYILA